MYLRPASCAQCTQVARSSRARTLAAVKSLLAFGQRTGYLPLNVGAALKLPARKDALAAHGIAFLTLPGRMGGSAMAAAAVNALASEAE